MERKSERLTVSALICALMIVSTLWLKFTIPGTDVFVTTQLFFVALCGQMLRPADCVFSLGAYLLLGLLGLPVFSAVQGIGVLATPSFGYLLGFPLSAATTAFVLARMGKRKGARLVAALAGLLVFYTVALSYIALLFSCYLAKPVAASVLFSAYFLAFLPLDIVKLVLAVGVADRLKRALR